MKPSKRELFYRSSMETVFNTGGLVLDIGGSLRVDPKKNNRFDKKNLWLRELVKKADYKILDKVPDYNPDIVGDIHSLPFPDNSVDAIVCIAVLEHVEEPQLAVREMYRVLKPGGYCYIDVPFLFYYHPMKGYYGDFYRFTCEGVRYMTRQFSSIQLVNGRGAFETVMNLFPFFSKKSDLFSWFDVLLKKKDSNQTSGYAAFCVK